MSQESPRRTAQDFAPEVLSLFDRYVHGLISRRAFLTGAARYTTGGLTAAALLAALSPQYAQAQQVRPDDARLDASYVEIDSPQGYGKLRAYRVQPANARQMLPVVLVAHENRGLNPHIEDVARRLALENYIALAPDALFPLGGYPGDEDLARERFAQLDQKRTEADFVAAARWLRGSKGGNGRLGVVGFCYGGRIANLLAARLGGELTAAVPFYGGGAPLEEVANIKAELQLHFAEHDERINAAWPPYEAALKAAGVQYHAHHYPGTQHGFHNDTTPRYDAAAAKLAWQRTLDLFERTLRKG